MKKIKTIKSKILMFIFALILPLSATGLVYSLDGTLTAKADDSTSASNYYSGYLKEISLSNNNFSSSTSNYSISSSLSGWTGQNTNSKTTAGIINTGNTFQTYMTSTYRLSKNPETKAKSDKYILMINSKTSDTSDSAKYATAQQGYKSTSVSLEKNSFYSFQVSFKSDTNYNSFTSYSKYGQTDTDLTVTKSNFEKTSFNGYAEVTYKNKTYYVQKSLTEKETLTQAIENAEIFYEDDEYVGFLQGDDAVYTLAENVEQVEGSTFKNIKSGAVLYTCNLQYQKSGNTISYIAPANSDYYTTKTDYTSLNDYVYGSMYLEGLTDKDGNTVEAQFVRVTSKEWETFYFFVATGDTEQTVNLNLWLGEKLADRKSSGVVFFDDCHVYQYSENTFWKTYQSYFGAKFSQEITEGNTTTTKDFDCVKFVDLRSTETLDYSSSNFDFEAGIYNDDVTSLKNWSKSGSGKAQVFNVKAPQYFKSVTGYDFVGSNLSCNATVGDEGVTISANNYVLGLWANEEYVKVTSQDIDINANELYKIKAYYKISSLESGNVYMYVAENDKVLTTYKLSNTQYTLKEETASSAITENDDNDFANDYGVIEFYVKGGALYNSSVNISLALGSADETATGCAVFDDVTVEKVTTDEYNDAVDNSENYVELNASSGTLTVPNGNFNSVTITDYNTPYSAQNWTITNGNGILFDGVIRTDSTSYAKYVEAFKTYQQSEKTADENNPYYWASYSNPKNSSNSVSDVDNVMMLANITKSWQQLKSDTISLDTANGTYALTFKYKTVDTSNPAKIKVSLYNSDNVKLFESEELSTNGAWKDYTIYIKSFQGTTDTYLTIDFGTSTDGTSGFAYFDNFSLSTIESTIFENKVDTAEGNTATFGVVDMSDFLLKLPTNSISSDLSKTYTPAYTGSVSSGDSITGGIVSSDKFDIEDTSKTFAIEKSSDEESKNVFFITSQGVGSYVIESNYTIDLEADNYYVLSFKLKTSFKYSANNYNLDTSKTYTYGVTFGLTDFDYMTELKSNEEYTTYTMYFNPSEDASVKLHIALVCDDSDTVGSMAIYDIAFAESTEDDYTTATETTSADGYDVNESKVFVSKADGDTSDDDSSDDTTDDDTSDETTTQNSNWLVIPSLITALAIVIGVVGYLMRKIKIKKIEKKRKETYDRKSSLNVDIIKTKARKQRDAEVEEIKANIKKFQNELDNLEKLHKQKVLNLREKDKGSVSKETDKEFKVFAQKRTVIAEKIDSLNKQIEDIKSPEYLLNLERKVYAQEEMKQKELQKLSKKMNKEKASAEKTEQQTKNTTKKSK